MDQITQKEWLRFLNLLHNKLRNSRGIKLTEMPALLEISNFMLFRFLDNDNLGIQIPEELKFKHMYLKYATDKKIKEDLSIPKTSREIRNCDKLWSDVYDSQGNRENCLIKKYYETDTIQRYLDSTVTRVSAFVNKPEASETIQEIVNIIYKKFKNIEFNSEFFDMFGSAYEEFKTNAVGNTGKHTQQHFTNVHIKKIVISELQPQSNEIFYEPCAGSGGFIHTAYHYVRNNETDKKADKFKTNIYANECNPEIFRPLLLNMLFHNIPVDNIIEQDSLSHENVTTMRKKADIIATNYPFGMSTTIEVGMKDKKTLEYWDVLETPSKGGKTSYVKSSSAQFVVHICNSLKEDGRAGFVSDRGILNNGCSKSTTWESRLRKFMFEENNVYKIIFLPQGAFTYTNFQTCIIFLTKGETTKECKLYNAMFRNPKDKTSEIYVEDEPIKTFTIEELRKNNYSVKIDEHIEQFEDNYVKLGDIVKFTRGKSITIDKLVAGDYKVIGGGYTFMSNTHNEYNCEPNDVIMSGDGAYAGFINKFNQKIMITNHCNKMLMVNDKFSKDFMYYFLKIQYQHKLITREHGFQKGQAQPAIDSNKMYDDICVPDITLSRQEEIVEFLDKQFENYNIELLVPYTKDIDLFKLLIHKKYNECADALHIIYRKIEVDAIHKKFELDKKAIFNMNVSLVESKEYMLGDLTEFEGKKMNLKAKDGIDEGKYKFYSCSKNIKFYDKCEYEKECLIINGGGKADIRIDTNFSISNDMHVVCVNNDIVTNKFIYMYLKFNIQLLEQLFHGNGLKHISKGNISKCIIRVPSLEDQQKIIKKIEEVENEQSSYNKYAKILQEQIDQMNETIKNICTIRKQNVDADDNNESSDEEDQITKKDNTKKSKSDVDEDDLYDDASFIGHSKRHNGHDDTSNNSNTDIKVKKVLKTKKSDSDSDRSYDDELRDEKKRKKKVSKMKKNDSDSEQDCNSDNEHNRKDKKDSETKRANNNDKKTKKVKSQSDTKKKIIKTDNYQKKLKVVKRKSDESDDDHFDIAMK